MACFSSEKDLTFSESVLCSHCNYPVLKILKLSCNRDYCSDKEDPFPKYNRYVCLYCGKVLKKHLIMFEQKSMFLLVIISSFLCFQQLNFQYLII